MIYSIYIPGEAAADRTRLAEVGLGELHRAGDANLICSACMAGPDGQPGQIWTWDEGNNIAAYQPERQRWEPCHADAHFPAGRFWWGFPIDGLRELDLRRSAPFEGRPLTLGGESWIVPNIGGLPEVYAFDGDGNRTLLKRKEFRWFANDCEWAYAQVMGNEPVDVWRQLEVASRMLSLNYRVTPELLMRLELLSPDDALQVLVRAVDQQRLRALVDEIKNREGGAPGPSGSAAVDGPKD